MNYDTMMELLKTDMKASIDRIDLDDVSTYENYIEVQKLQRRIAGDLFNIRQLVPKSEDSVKTVKPLDDIVEAVGDQLREVDEAIDNKRQTGVSDAVPSETGFPVVIPLRRALKGGILQIKPGSAADATEYIPEHIIRNLGVDHGDLIKVFAKTDDADSRNYEVVERLDSHELPDDMVVIEQAVVSYNDVLHNYTVDSYVTDSGRVERFKIDVHGVNLFKIHHKDIETLDLQAGDIVDIAYYKGKDVVRIRWRHDLQLDPSRTELVNRKKHSYYKTDNSSEKADVLPIFNGNTIAIAGAPSYVSAYTEEIEKRGGQVVFIRDNSSDSIDQGVKGADLLVLPIRESSHRLCETAKESAKRYNIPFTVLDGAGRNLLIRTLSDALGVLDV